MSKIIGAVGKGGCGKTTLVALFLKSLLEKGKGLILVIDADPNEGLPSTLDIKNYSTISNVMEGSKGEVVNFKKFEDKLESLLLENEQERYDILLMGRGEGKGCYCLINNLLKSFIERSILRKNCYDYILMDCEAGLEHVSRKTSDSVDDLVIVTDSSKKGLDTIQRIKDISKEVKTEVEKFYVVSSRVKDEKISNKIKERCTELDMFYLGNIPFDPLVEEFDFEGKSLLELPTNSLAYKEVSEMLERIL
ncbi:MAG: AAA family ATPase [Methanobacteriota archaeon]